MSRAIPPGIRPLSAVRFDFTSDSDRMGLPHCYVDNHNIDIFALPVYVCDDDKLEACAWACGGELALIVLADRRNWHIRGDTRALDDVIALPPSPDFAQFVRMLGAHGARGSEWRHGVYDAFFSTLEDALNHAVTARDDPVRDAMIPAELDLLTPAAAEARLRAVLSGESVPEIVFRTGRPL